MGSVWPVVGVAEERVNGRVGCRQRGDPQTFTGEPGSVFAITWGKDGKRLITGRNNGTLCWWDVDTWKLLHICQAHHNAVYSVQVSPDGRLLASCGDDNSVKVWGMETTELVQTLRRDRPYERLHITGARTHCRAESYLARFGCL